MLGAFGSTLDAREPSADLRPYRVRIAAAFDSDPSLTPAFRRQTLDHLAALIDRTCGAMWDATIAEEPHLWPAGPAGLERLTPDSVVGRISNPSAPAVGRISNPSAPPTDGLTNRPADVQDGLKNRPTQGEDKIFFLTVEARGGRYRLAGREWDAAMRRLGPIRTAEAFERHELAETAFDLVRRLFHPLLDVEEAGDELVTLRLRAGSLPPSDPGAAQVGPGDLLRPFFRYLDREGDVRQLQMLPWTYLVVETVERERVTCRLVSGLRTPLGTGRTRRVEAMATVLRPHLDATRLRLTTRSNPPRPLSGQNVSLVPKTFADDEPDDKPQHLLTDRRGTLRVPADPEQPLVWLYVHSGETLLARVPFVPGVQPEATIELPDDSLRLQVAGELDLLKGRLVDAVAQRAVVLARARSFARGGDWEKADAEIGRLKTLPGISHFEAQLTFIRTPALDSARRANDRTTEARIRKLCDDASQLIRRYLDRDRLRAALEEIEELRKIEAEQKAVIGRDP